MSVSTPIARLPRGRWLLVSVFALAALFLALPRHASAALAPNCDVPCTLYAEAGTISAADLPGAGPLTVWGFNLDGSTPTAPGGTTLVVTAGQQVTITLNNALSEPVSLSIPQQAGRIETATPGVYQFTPSHPGTYLYEAGPGNEAKHQVAMGLYGALVVLPATGVGAYGSTDTLYDEEFPLVLSEIDPALNNSLNPAAFDMKSFTPRYWLIGGHTYGAGVGIPDLTSVPGHTVLLRYVNAGVRDHSMGLLGLHQRIVGNDSYALGIESYQTVAETVAPGQTLDALVTVPSGTTGGRYAVSDQGQHLDNNGAGWKEVGMTGASPLTTGGMLTFITTAAGTCSGGPVASSPTISQSTVSTAGPPVTASATFTACGTNTVDAAEYFVDNSSGAPGTGVAATLSPPLGGNVVTASATVNPASPPLAPGVHHISLRAHDVTTNAWGSLVTLTFTVGAGPTTSNVAATVNGDNSVTMTAIANDTTSGNDNIAAAEFFIDTTGALQHVDVDATGGTFTISFGGKTTTPLTYNASPAAVQTALRALLSINGPNVNVSGTPSHYVLAFVGTLATTNVAQVTCDSGLLTGNTHTATPSSVANPGTSMTATDTLFNSPVEALTGTISPATASGLASGTHTVYVHSQDAASNWGGFASTTFTVSDNVGPVVSAVTLFPNPNNGTLTRDINVFQEEISAHVQDPGLKSNIVVVEGVFDNALFAQGSGAIFLPRDGTFNSPSEDVYMDIQLSSVAALAEGTHTFYVRGKDAAGNWGALASGTITIDKTGPTTTVAPLVPPLDAIARTLNATATDAPHGTFGSPAAVNSNIAAAEWFIGADPGVGNGNPMQASDGNFNSTTESLTASLAALTPGVYTISIRAKDVAGNWGPVSTTVYVTDAIFANSFTFATPQASLPTAPWSSRSPGGSTAIAANLAAALNPLGTCCGMQITLGGGAARYVQNNSPIGAGPPAEKSYHARFYFNPNSSLSAAGAPPAGARNTWVTIFAGRAPGAATAFVVQYQRTTGTPGSFQVRAGAARTSPAPAYLFTSAFTISDASHWIEINWLSAVSGSLALSIDAASPLQTLTVNNNTLTVTDVRLGPSNVSLGGTGALPAAASGTLFFDAFVSTRFSTIGP